MGHIKTDFLVAQPSLETGVSRLLDFYGLYDSYNMSPSVTEADAIATRADWSKVGQELLEAMERFEQEQKRA
jgi:hypothetical protein